MVLYSCDMEEQKENRPIEPGHVDEADLAWTFWKNVDLGGGVHVSIVCLYGIRLIRRSHRDQQGRC